jgi:hypothetical protein
MHTADHCETEKGSSPQLYMPSYSLAGGNKGASVGLTHVFPYVVV